MSTTVRPLLGFRPLLASGMVLVTAGAVALGPALAAHPAPSAQLPVLPTVHVEEIELVGIGLNIYNAITPGVQYAVGGVSYLVNVIPVIGGPIAAQININYFQGIQPIIEATVNYLAGVVADPLTFIPTTQAYGVTLYDIGYNWVSAQLRFLGLPELAPLPPIAATGSARPARPTAAVPAVVAAAALRSSANPVRAVRAAAAAPAAAVAAERPTGGDPARPGAKVSRTGLHRSGQPDRPVRPAH